MPKPRSSKSTLFQVLNNAQCPLYLLDDQGHILFANEPLCNWIALDFEQIKMVQCIPATEPIPQQPEDSLRGLAIPPSAYQHPYSLGKVFRTAADRHLIWRAASFIRLSGNHDVTGNVLVVLNQTDEDSATIEETPKPWLRQLIADLKNASNQTLDLDRFLGTSPSAVRLNEQIQAACQSHCNLLIAGPSGAGLQELATSIHEKRYPESSLPITPIQCAIADAQSIQSTIIQTQSLRGSQRAGDWFMLLEPENLNPEAVNELSGFLQLPRHNLNFLSICSQPKQIDRRLTDFLNIMQIEVSPLRERKSDIPILASYFLKQHSQNNLAEFDPAAQQLLCDYDWPNDIKELEDTIVTIAESLDDPTVSPDQFPDRFHHALQAQQIGAESIPVINLDSYLASIEAELIKRAMKQANHNKAKACKLLGISRAKLGRRIQLLGIDNDESEPVIFEESHDHE